GTRAEPAVPRYGLRGDRTADRFGDEVTRDGAGAQVAGDSAQVNVAAHRLDGRVSLYRAVEADLARDRLRVEYTERALELGAAGRRHHLDSASVRNAHESSQRAVEALEEPEAPPLVLDEEAVAGELDRGGVDQLLRTGERDRRLAAVGRRDLDLAEWEVDLEPDGPGGCEARRAPLRDPVQLRP